MSNNGRMISTYGEAEPLYRKAGFAPIPVDPSTKRPAVKGWTKRDLSQEEIDKRIRNHGDAGIGLLAGTAIDQQMNLGFVDIDEDKVVPFVREVIGQIQTAKRGSKGQTVAVRVPNSMKSVKISGPARDKPAVEVFANTGMTVIPDSIHPNGTPYVWLGKPLLDVDPTEHPILSSEKIEFIMRVLESEHAWEIINGGPSIKGHEPMLKLTSSGIANISDDTEWMARCLTALFAPGYAGDTPSEIEGMLTTARAKGLGKRSAKSSYDPGEDGPIPLGYTQEGSYALLDPIRQIIVLMSANQLLSKQCLQGLAPTEFWAKQFPSQKHGFSGEWAGETLIAACRSEGPFLPSRVRGRGIWLEDGRIVANLGGPVSSRKYLYLCFQPIEFNAVSEIDPKRVLTFLRTFNWRNPKDADLLFGWLCLAPICGVLNWRPHIFIYGPARSGKTTLHTVISKLLSPLVLSADGQSTEAGIRQSLGPDSLPVILDEFESDQNGSGLQRVIRLARSASSAENTVLRGTPEGRAQQYSLRTTFLFAAINPRGMSPADQSRIVMLELLMHENDRETAAFIATEEIYFRSLEDAWCAHMVSLADLIQPAIDAIEQKLASADRRHRQNMATLLAGGFVGLHSRVPTEIEAQSIADEFADVLRLHEEETERDDALECLDYLLSHVVDGIPLGHWCTTELMRQRSLGVNIHNNCQRILAINDLVLRSEGENEGLLIRNGSPAIDRIFSGSIWANRGWERALRKLDGAFRPKNPVQFASSKSRCLGIPLDLLPSEPLPWPDAADQY